MPLAPLSISSQSRKKLKSFEFQDGKEGVVVDKENVNVALRAVGRSIDQNVLDRTYSAPLPEAAHPHSPHERISLSDLTANPEDVFNRLPPMATPNDRVTWKHAPGSTPTPSSSGRTTQRGTKRAHSSSPTSSVQADRSRHFALDGETMNMRSLSQSLQRTPSRHLSNHDDPAAALWSHYTDRRNEPVLPPLPMMESSPRTPTESKKDSSLRRVQSCANEWPSSEAKRRKLNKHDPHSTTRELFASRRKEFMQPELSKQSRVSLLLESVHQSLTNRAMPGPEGPSSSSPLPNRQYDPQKSQVWPNAHKVLDTVVEDQDEDESLTVSLALTDTRDESSDYGDLDLDEDDFEVIEQALTQAPHVQTSLADCPNPPSVFHTKTPQLANDIEDIQRLHTVAQAPPVRPKSPEEILQPVQAPNDAQSSSAPLSDNFGDFDDDDDGDETFATEMRELAAKIDSQGVLPPVRQPIPTTDGAASPSYQARQDSFGEFNDAFGNDDDDNDEDLWKQIDQKAARILPAITSGSQKKSDNRAIKRYLIVDVFESNYEITSGRKRPEKMLSIRDEKTKHLYTILLRQSWYESRCVKDSYLHLIGNFDWTGQCIVDDNDNMVILHPDHLISATVVADSFTCLRRATLQDRVKATLPPEKPQVYGHILHEVFGEAMKLNSWEMETFYGIIMKLIPNYIESLYEIRVQIPDAVEHLMSKAPLMKAWANMFVSADFVPDAVIRDRNGTFVPMNINKLLELEEHVWSPMYGLKGNIDATVQVQMKMPQTMAVVQTLTLPLELKTGMKDSNEMHRAQTALYTLLLSDRYDVNVTCGVLYYMETSKTFRVEQIRNEIRHMIIQRNELACYVHDKLALPPMIKREHVCKRCYAQTSCFTYHKLVEGGDGTSSGMKEVFDEVVRHLKPVHQEFFRKWDDLITKEERDSMKFKRELWTMLSTEREQVGRCFSNVLIEPGSAVENHDSPKINRYTYSFNKHMPLPGFAFTESQITIGEPIVISDEKGHFALACGFVTSVQPASITVAVDRRLQNARRKAPGFDADNNQTFAGIMEVRKDGQMFVPSPTNIETPTLYRIDKDEFANGMATARNNMIRLMEKDLFRARDLRQLIVEQRAPVFKDCSTAYALSGPASQQNLNVDQRRAIEKVMSAKDYALVLGMPGTGKTTTIAHIIRALVSQGKSVLLTSYTHTAVDNILLKIKDANIPILRLGSVGKIHPEVHQFADLGGIPKKSIEELEKSWQSSKVVATTCLGINQGIFNHRIFDYCIVDEASQITLPVCLGPIRLASTFILVGDHYQLPPLVQNKEAQEGGLDVSLFKLLSDAQPDGVVNLEHQYRMAEDIMFLSNELIYNGRLKCGTEGVAKRMLTVPRLDEALNACHHHEASTISKVQSSTIVCIQDEKCWIRRTLTPQARCVFLSTDHIPPPPATAISKNQDHETGAFETVHGSRITNTIESVLIAQLLSTLLASGVPARSIGIITFYRSQLALLKRQVKSLCVNGGHATSATDDVEIHTADKFQGRDKDVILLSCVRSNATNNVGELLRDWRRVNVTVTRAKSKLVLVGSLRTLGGSDVEVLQGLCRIVREKKWVVDIDAPVDAHVDIFSTHDGVPSQKRSWTGEEKFESRVEMGAKNATRAPLRDTSANVGLHRTQLVSVGKGVRVPGKVIQGSVPVTMDTYRLLNHAPILRNVIDEFGDA